MLVPLDYKDLLKVLNKHKVRYLIIGAYAVIHYTEPRYTKDLDVWVEPTAENAKKVYGALKEFGAPLKDVKIEDFTRPDLIYQVGVPPVRVDIIMSVMGMGFEAAWKTRTRTKIDEVETNIIGMRDLVKSKERVSRPADLIDIANLKLGLKLKRRS